MTHLALLIAYSIAQMALGLWIGRRVRTTSTFFVAGRTLGPTLLFSTVLAANIGAGSTVGAAGLGYRDGLSAWWWVGAAGIGSLVLAFWVGPRLRDIAATHDLRTMGDFLEWRYGPSVRVVVAVLLWFNTLTVLAGQLIALAFVLNAVAGVPKTVGCLIGAAVMTTYFVAGGLLSAAAVNLVQLVVLVAGFALALPIALGAAGGMSALLNAGASSDYGNFWQGGASGWTYLAMLGPSFIVSPGLVQKVYGARDARAVRVGVGLNAMALMIFALAPALLGMAARVLHPQLDNREMALPTLLVADLPPLVGSLGLAALFSAEVSTADAILFMLATSLSQDLYRRFLRPDADDRRVLFVARATAMAGGAAGVLLAVVAETIIGSLTIFYTLMTVILFVPVIAGLYSRRARSIEALAAIGAGLSALIALQLFKGAATSPLFNPAIVGVSAAAVAAAAATIVRKGN